MHKTIRGVGLGLIVVFAVIWFGGMRIAYAKGISTAAKRLYAQGDYAAAAEQFRRAARFGYPQQREHAAALYHIGRFEEAKGLLRDRSIDHREQIVYGVIALAERDDMAAESAFQSVLSYPDKPSDLGYTASDLADIKALAAYNLSLLYRRKGDTKRANDLRRKAVMLSNGSAKEWSGPQPMNPRYLQSYQASPEQAGSDR